LDYTVDQSLIGAITEQNNAESPERDRCTVGNTPNSLSGACHTDVAGRPRVDAMSIYPSAPPCRRQAEIEPAQIGSISETRKDRGKVTMDGL